MCEEVEGRTKADMCDKGGVFQECLDVRGAHAQRRPQWHRWRLAAALSSSTGVPREGRSVATSRCSVAPRSGKSDLLDV